MSIFLSHLLVSLTCKVAVAVCFSELISHLQFVGGCAPFSPSLSDGSCRDMLTSVHPRRYHCKIKCDRGQAASSCFFDSGCQLLFQTSSSWLEYSVAISSKEYHDDPVPADHGVADRLQYA